MSAFASAGSVVGTQWVADHLHDPGIRIVEVIWGAEGQHGFPAYAGRHIPGAVAWDYQADYDETTGDVIEQRVFEKQLSDSGVTPDMTVVLYSSLNNLLATFEFWLMKYYGHKDVRLLDGDKSKWLAEGRPLEQATPVYAPVSYRAREDDWGVRASRDDMLRAIGQDGVLIVDARPADMSSGQSHPTTAVGGHIPTAINLPAVRILVSDGAFLGWRVPSVRDDGTFKTREELEALLVEHGITVDKEIYTYCLRGGLSTHLWFVLTQLVGYPNVREYDRSWAEWGNREDLPVEN